VVLRVGDVEIALSIQEKPRRAVQGRVRGLAAVARRARRPNTSDGRDDSGGVNLADAVIAGVGNVQIAGPVRGQAPWSI